MLLSEPANHSNHSPEFQHNYYYYYYFYYFLLMEISLKFIMWKIIWCSFVPFFHIQLHISKLIKYSFFFLWPKIPCLYFVYFLLEQLSRQPITILHKHTVTVNYLYSDYFDLFVFFIFVCWFCVHCFVI